MTKEAGNSTYSIIKLLNRYCEKVLLFLSGLSLIIMTAIILYSIVGRIFSLPVLWTNEVASFLIIYVTFLSAPWILQQNGHVQVDIIISKLNEKNTYMNRMLISVIGGFISIILFWYSLHFTFDSFQKGKDLFSMGIQWPEYILYLPIPLGTFFLTIRFILNFVESFLNLSHLRKPNSDKKMTITQEHTNGGD